MLTYVAPVVFSYEHRIALIFAFKDTPFITNYYFCFISLCKYIKVENS
jgi:hypothetical protein